MDLILVIFLILIVVKYFSEVVLVWMNVGYARQHIDGETGRLFYPEDHERGRALDYLTANSRMGMVENSLMTVLLMAVVFCGFFPFWYDLITQWIGVSIWGEALFLFSMLILSGIISLPLDWYNTFRLEERFGFNTMTFGLWCKDKLLMFVISCILFYPLLALILYAAEWSGEWWWIWVFGIVVVFQLFMFLIVPVVIMPLFYKFKPLPDGSLKDKLESLAEKAGVSIRSIKVMDGSKRSKHSNAFFTGIGKSKSIVLFDTLIEQMDEDEIAAVAAHEMGHQIKRHQLWNMVWNDTILLIQLFIMSLLINQTWLMEPFGFSGERFVTGLLVLSLFGYGILFWLSPLENAFSRKIEYEADRFAAQLTGDRESIMSLLKKIGTENLFNPTPHPVFSTFYYSHPTVPERIAALKSE